MILRRINLNAATRIRIFLNLFIQIWSIAALGSIVCALILAALGGVIFGLGIGNVLTTLVSDFKGDDALVILVGGSIFIGFATFWPKLLELGTHLRHRGIGASIVLLGLIIGGVLLYFDGSITIRNLKIILSTIWDFLLYLFDNRGMFYPLNAWIFPGFLVLIVICIRLTALHDQSDAFPLHKRLIRLAEMVLWWFWLALAVWSIAVVPLLDADNLPLTAIIFALFWFFVRDKYFDLPNEFVQIITFLLPVGLVFFAIIATIFPIKQLMISWSAAPLFNPTEGSRHPTSSAIALIMCLVIVYFGYCLYVSTISTFYRILIIVLLIPAIAWLFTFAVHEPLAVLRAARKEILHDTNILIVECKTHVAISLSLGKHVCLLIIERTWGQLVLAWPKVLLVILIYIRVFAIFIYILVPWWIISIGRTIFSDHMAAAIAISVPPATFKARLSYALGLPSSSYHISMRNGYATALAVIGRFFFFLFLIPVCLLVLNVGEVFDGWLVDNVNEAARGSNKGLQFPFIGRSIIFATIFLFVSILLRGLSNQLRMRSYKMNSQKDDRPPLLYLRSFLDDQLPFYDLSALYVGEAERTLDAIILATGGEYGPLVTAGRKAQRLHPFGAIRYQYDVDWQNDIRDLIDSAQMIFVVVNTTHGVLWEIDHILHSEARTRSLFLFPPSLNTSARGELFQRITGEPEPSDLRQLIGLFIIENQCVIMDCGYYGFATFHCAVRCFLGLRESTVNECD